MAGRPAVYVLDSFALLAYADAFAVVTARDFKGVLVIGDPELRSLAEAGLVSVEWLPR